MKKQKLSYQAAIEHLTHIQHCSWKLNNPQFQFLYSNEKQKIIGHSNTYAIRRFKDGFVKVSADVPLAGKLVSHFGNVLMGNIVERVVYIL